MTGRTARGRHRNGKCPAPRQASHSSPPTSKERRCLIESRLGRRPTDFDPSIALAAIVRSKPRHWRGSIRLGTDRAWIECAAVVMANGTRFAPARRQGPSAAWEAASDRKTEQAEPEAQADRRHAKNAETERPRILGGFDTQPIVVRGLHGHRQRLIARAGTSLSSHKILRTVEFGPRRAKIGEVRMQGPAS